MTQTCGVRAILCIGFLFSIVIFSKAGVPTLQWDPNKEPTIAGYNVYCGEISGSYSRVVDVGLATSFPLTNLNPGVTYYFAVTAYDVNRLESPFSDEIWYTPPVDGTNAVLLPLTLRLGSTNASIRFLPYAGQRCRVVASTDLVRWEEVQAVTVSTNGPVEIPDSADLDQPHRFYRVVATP